MRNRSVKEDVISSSKKMIRMRNEMGANDMSEMAKVFKEQPRQTRLERGKHPCRFALAVCLMSL
jgi:hypothetical protein